MELTPGEGYARENVTIRDVTCVCVCGGGIASVENLLKFLRRVRCPRSLHSTHSFAIHNNPYIYIFPPFPYGIITSAVVLCPCVFCEIIVCLLNRINPYSTVNTCDGRKRGQG